MNCWIGMLSTRSFSSSRSRLQRRPIRHRCLERRVSCVIHAKLNRGPAFEINVHRPDSKLHTKRGAPSDEADIASANVLPIVVTAIGSSRRA